MGLNRITQYAPDTGSATPSWHTEAACRDIARPEIFFPHGKEQAEHGAAAALPYCNACPVVFECLRAAFAGNEHGTWGGMTHAERQKLKSRLKGSDWGTVEALREALEVTLPRCEDCGQHRKPKAEGRCAECFRSFAAARIAEEAARIKSECTEPDCTVKVHAKGKCRRHYLIDLRASKSRARKEKVAA